MTQLSLMTAEELFNSPQKQKHCELVHGELITMAPSNPEHGAITFNVAGLLRNFIRKNKLGAGFGAETGFILARNPDTVRAPDCAFICKDRIPKEGLPRKFWSIAPDLVVEVLSPSDSASDVNEKIDEWLAAGTRLIWVIDPKTKKVTVYTPNRQPTILRITDSLSGEEILPGFDLPIVELFE